MKGLRSGGSAGQHNSNTGARPSAPFRSNVYQPTEMTMILNGGAVSTSSQSQVHAAYTPLSHSTGRRDCMHICAFQTAHHCTRMRETCECGGAGRVHEPTPFFCEHKHGTGPVSNGRPSDVDRC